MNEKDYRHLGIWFCVFCIVVSAVVIGVGVIVILPVKAPANKLNSEIIEKQVVELERIRELNDIRIEQLEKENQRITIGLSEIGEMVSSIQARSRRGAQTIDEIIDLADKLLEITAVDN
jgi:transketolase C-terminal domain/subunit